MAVSRAGGSPSDAVLLQDAKGVHWGPALIRVLEGRYCFRVTSLPAGNSAPTVRTFTIEWDRDVDAEGAVTVVGLTPGSYWLEKGKPSSTSCIVDQDATPAWVLITAATNFARANTDWKQGQSFLNSLEGDLGLSASTTLRRALLSSIEDSLSRP
jgi:hypothetical protein